MAASPDDARAVHEREGVPEHVERIGPLTHRGVECALEIVHRLHVEGKQRHTGTLGSRRECLGHQVLVDRVGGIHEDGEAGELDRRLPEQLDHALADLPRQIRGQSGHVAFRPRQIADEPVRHRIRRHDEDDRDRLGRGRGSARGPERGRDDQIDLRADKVRREPRQALGIALR